MPTWLVQPEQNCFLSLHFQQKKAHWRYIQHHNQSRIEGHFQNWDHRRHPIRFLQNFSSTICTDNLSNRIYFRKICALIDIQQNIWILTSRTPNSSLTISWTRLTRNFTLRAYKKHRCIICYLFFYCKINIMNFEMGKIVIVSWNHFLTWDVRSNIAFSRFIELLSSYKMVPGSVCVTLSLFKVVCQSYNPGFVD